MSLAAILAANIQARPRSVTNPLRALSYDLRIVPTQPGLDGRALLHAMDATSNAQVSIL